MSDFGGKLRLARERRGISLRQIAASTRISAATLDALERNDFSRLPAGIFSRAFVRAYATEVGLDPDETVREFLEHVHAEAPVTPASAPPVAEDEGAFESQQRMASVLLKLIVISIPIGGAILYFTLRPRPAAPAAPPAVEQPAPAPSRAPQVETAPQRDAVRAADATPAVLRVELRPVADCWVRLTIDGSPVMARVMKAGETEVRAAHDVIEIEVGDAGAFAFSIDGRPAKPLGTAGQVRSARITRGTMGSYLQ